MTILDLPEGCGGQVLNFAEFWDLVTEITTGGFRWVAADGKKMTGVAWLIGRMST